MLELRVGVVGNCVAGKSTLVGQLRAKGYNAINIPQEHSVSRRFWRRLNPDFLIYLSCTLETARKRRQIGWGQERLNDQWDILSEVREHANLTIATDNITVDDVVALSEQAIIDFVNKEKRNGEDRHPQ